ncbi:hypothetical protein KQI74_01340 [Paenibacillus barcinonensis]|uniref:hypothetical protein n=1 Tax=Paenibacillus TaxID=44249 RepID=UPI001C0F4F50|nr:MULTISPECIES: hypothetical protein [Paenibacillus]MBU5350902.1 hypothetical protein [Paenibacillus barcinonensis]MDM5278481.1 hypothetical protein [Paenibacillus silvae]
MTEEIKYLTKNGDYAILEMDSGSLNPEETMVSLESSEKKVWKKELVSLNGVPEIKVETCHRRVRIPGNGNANIPYPCTCTRTGRHWMELRVYYPSDLAQDAVDILIKCATEAAAYAAGVIVVSTIAPPLIGPAIPTATTLFVERFKSCVSEEVYNSVTYEFSHEQESGDWNC